MGKDAVDLLDSFVTKILIINVHILHKGLLRKVEEFSDNNVENARLVNLILKSFFGLEFPPVFLGGFVNELLPVVVNELHEQIRQVDALEEVLLGLLVVAVAGVPYQGIVVCAALIEVEQLVAFH